MARKATMATRPVSWWPHEAPWKTPGSNIHMLNFTRTLIAQEVGSLQLLPWDGKSKKKHSCIKG